MGGQKPQEKALPSGLNNWTVRHCAWPKAGKPARSPGALSPAAHHSLARRTLLLEGDLCFHACSGLASWTGHHMDWTPHAASGTKMQCPWGPRTIPTASNADISASQYSSSSTRMNWPRHQGLMRCWSRGLWPQPPTIAAISSDFMFMVLSTTLRAQNHPEEVWPQLLHILDVSSAVNWVKSSESYSKLCCALAVCPWHVL